MTLGTLPKADLHIALTDDLVTPALITRHLKVIADTYSKNWSYDKSRRHHDFVVIRGNCSVPAGLTWDLGFGAEDVRLTTEGVLCPGQIDGSVTGFYASVSTETRFLAYDEDDYDRSAEVFVEAYPCRHVPVPANW